jgi:hypothetical protein
MSTSPFSDAASSRSTWQEPYARAILEPDNTKVPERIAEARHAIRDRAEELLSDHRVWSDDERRALNNALRNLRLLEGVTAREDCASERSPSGNPLTVRRFP